MVGGIKTICGGVGFGAFSTQESVEELMNVLEAAGVHNFDTARIYAGGQGETLLGKVKAGSRFTIDTKVGGGFVPGSLKKGELVKNAKASLHALGMDKVGEEIIYNYQKLIMCRLTFTTSMRQNMMSPLPKS